MCLKRLENENGLHYKSSGQEGVMANYVGECTVPLGRKVLCLWSTLNEDAAACQVVFCRREAVVDRIHY